MKCQRKVGNVFAYQEFWSIITNIIPRCFQKNVNLLLNKKRNLLKAFITDEIEISFNDSDKGDSDEGNSDEEN